MQLELHILSRKAKILDTNLMVLEMNQKELRIGILLMIQECPMANSWSSARNHAEQCRQ